jgi:hypothetical protein
MARPFAKLAVGSGADEKLGIIAEQNGLGGMMFLLSIPEAYPYGILPGSPRAYRAKVIPSAMLPETEIQAAIDAQVEAGLIHRYEADGHELLYLVNYHRYQEVAWSKVRPSEHPLPECWRIPDALQAMIEDDALLRSKKQFGEYGVMGLPDTETEAPAPVPPSAPQVPAPATSVPAVASEKREAQGGHSTSTATSSDNDVPAVTLVDKCLNILAPLFPRGCSAGDRMTVENVIDSDPLAPEVVEVACIELAARANDGEKVRLSYLARNVADACYKLNQQREKDAASDPQQQSTSESGVFDWLINRTPEEQERIDAQAQAMWEQDRAEWAAAKAASGGGGA